MNKLREETNPNALARLYAEAERVLAAMAEAGAKRLDANLAAGPRSGVHYRHLPRRSSAPGEYSQEQSGRLRGMVRHGKLGFLRYYYGLVPRGRAEALQALAQEFGRPGMVGRANVTRTALDARTRTEMVEAGRRA